MWLVRSALLRFSSLVNFFSGSLGIISYWIRINRERVRQREVVSVSCGGGEECEQIRREGDEARARMGDSVCGQEQNAQGDKPVLLS